VIVLTDGDSGGLEPGATPPGEMRKRDLETTAADLQADELLSVVINDYSLESELVRAGNVKLMKRLYLAVNPRSEEKWEKAVALDGEEQAVEVQKLFDNTPKGDYAQLLAEEINDDKPFIVPKYLVCAIKALVA
jgi:putative ATP-dependent endonuclease of OLD family